MKGFDLMKKAWYVWIWSDGTETMAMGYSKTERAAIEREHGTLVRKVFLSY